MQCSHCNLKIVNPIYAEINNKKLTFCCSGCEVVAKILFNNNLLEFYNQQSNFKKLKFNNQYPLEYYDLADFRQEFVENDSMVLISPSIHCAACVWLIEKIMIQVKGVTSVRVGLSDMRIKINFDNSVKLSNIFQKLSQIGYAAEPFTQDQAEKLSNAYNIKLLQRLGFAAFAMMNLLWISIALYSGANEGKYNDYFLWISFLLATPTLLYSGSIFLHSGFLAIKNSQLNMDTPIAIGSVITYVYSALVLFGVVTGEVYFDTVVNFIFIILIGRYLEAIAKKSATLNANFLNLQPKAALLLDKGQQKITPSALLKKGDIILIKSGERIAADGILESGNLSVDESILTGESLEIAKKEGDKIFAGTMNMSGSATVIVQKKITHSSISKINAMVDDANLQKSSITCIVDKLIPYFVVTTIVIAIFAFIYNLQFGFDFALLSAISVLIVTCPCAFGIAVPITNTISISLALKQKIIIKNSNILQKLNDVDAVVFDKTGTLTTGNFIVKNINTNIDKNEFLQIISSIAKYSEHLLATSVFKKYQNHATLKVTNFFTKAGFGSSVTINNETYYFGSADYLKQNSIIGDYKQSNATSYIWCAQNKHIIGNIELVDEVKDDAESMIAVLKKTGKRIIMLTGDNQFVANSVAEKLQIDEVHANTKPDHKMNFIKNLQKNNSVLMVGDGINDAPALALADCSIAISGLDIVSNNADCSISRSLHSIIYLFKLSKITTTTIWQNIIFSLSYNSIIVPLAFFGFVSPLFAAIVMPISSLLVIGNSLKLKLTDKKLVKIV